MARIKNDLRDAIYTNTTFGKHTSLVGSLRFTTSMKIQGRFEGDIQSEGFLFIDEGAEIHADIKTRTLIVAGTIHGNIEAYERLEMLPTGKVYGNILTAKLRIVDGVIFEGKCEMIQNPDSIDIFSASGEELKKNVQVL